MGSNRFEVPNFFFLVNLQLFKLPLRRPYIHLNLAQQVRKNQVVSLTCGFLLFLKIQNLFLGKGLTF